MKHLIRKLTACLLCALLCCQALALPIHAEGARDALSGTGVMIAPKTVVPKTITPDVLSFTVSQPRAVIGTALTYTIVTNARATRVRIVNEAGAQLVSANSGYIELADGRRRWALPLALADPGFRMLRAYAGDAAGYTLAGRSLSVQIVKVGDPAVLQATPAKTVVNRQSPFYTTITANLESTRVRVLDEKGATVYELKSYTEGDGKRVFRTCFALGTAGERTLTAQAGDAQGYRDEGKTFQITVLVPGNPTVYSAVSDKAEYKLRESAAFTVTTNLDATYVLLADEAGALLKQVTSGYTDEGNVRTWKFSYAPDTAGERALRVYAGDAAARAAKYAVVKLRVVDPGARWKAISLAMELNDRVAINKPSKFFMTTEKGLTSVYVRSRDGTIAREFTAKDAEVVRGQTTDIWSLELSFRRVGTCELMAYAGTDNRAVDSPVTLRVTVRNPAPVIYSIKADKTAYAWNEPVVFTVVTDTATTSVQVGGAVTSGYKTAAESESDGRRTWRLAVRAVSAGNAEFFVSSVNNYTRQQYALPMKDKPQILSRACVSPVILPAKAALRVETNKTATLLQVTLNGKVYGKATKYVDKGDRRYWDYAVTLPNAGGHKITLQAGSVYGLTNVESIEVSAAAKGKAFTVYKASVAASGGATKLDVTLDWSGARPKYDSVLFTLRDARGDAVADSSGATPTHPASDRLRVVHTLGKVSPGAYTLHALVKYANGTAYEVKRQITVK